MITIQFYGELTEELGINIVNQLLDIYEKNQTILEANDRLKYKADHLPLYCDEITFLISSPGGLLYSFMDIWDAIDKLKQQGVVFKGRVSSFAMSAGFYTYCLMDYREMTPYATLMCHEMATWRNDKLTNLDLEVKRMTKIQAQLDKLVTDNTKITQEMLDKSKGTDLYFDYDMALEYGIVKEELSEEEQLAKALEDMDKEDMTQAEFDAFVEEMKSYVNIVPDEDTEEEIQDKIKEIEGDTEPDMALGEAVKEVLGEDFKCNGETKCNEFGDRCCYMCENFGKCDLLCECAERAETCEHIENKLDELDSKCIDDEDEHEDNEIKEWEDIEEMKQYVDITTDDKEEVECVEPANCEKYKGSHKCCNFCEDKSSDCKFNICAYAFDKEECEYIKNN